MLTTTIAYGSSSGNGYLFAQANCPSGMQILSGGCDEPDAGGGYLKASGLNPSPAFWYCGSYPQTTNWRTLYATAVCATY